MLNPEQNNTLLGMKIIMFFLLTITNSHLSENKLKMLQENNKLRNSFLQKH